MNGTKSALASVGVWGGVIAVITGALGFFGYALSADDAATAATHAQSIYDAVMAGVTAVGGLLAIWGRLRATKQIG